MKKIVLLLIIYSFLGSCKKDLEDIELNNNPYDKSYSGPSVIKIDTVYRIKTGTTTYATKLSVKSSIDMYQFVVLFRNGVEIKKIAKNSYGSSLLETIYDQSAITGITYSYTASLKYDEGLTQKSPVYSFTTNP